jgi:hypothetical protein
LGKSESWKVSGLANKTAEGERRRQGKDGGCRKGKVGEGGMEEQDLKFPLFV